jgi:hypothetical protein
MNAPTVVERKTVRRIYGPIKEEESWRTGTNKEIGDILQGAGTVKFIKSLRLRWYQYTERMSNE